MPDRRMFDSSSMTPPPESRGEAMTCNIENMASDEPMQVSQGFVPMPMPSSFKSETR